MTAFDVGAVEDKFLEIDGEKYFQMSPVTMLAYAHMEQDDTYRWGQAMYNILSHIGQSGLPSPWPDFFHQPNEFLARIEFDKRFVVEDDYIIPRDVVAGTPAYI